MRIVFSGASDITIQAVSLLIEKGYEIIIIEEDEKKVKELQEQLDCAIMQGDAANPKILQETNPKTVDFLITLTDSDPDNILCGLVGKSLEVKNIIVTVRNASYEKICLELGLENTLIPSRTIARYLLDFIETKESIELKDYIKDEAQMVKVIVEGDKIKSVEDLNLPSNARAICFYRDEKFNLILDNASLKNNDEVIILTNKEMAANLQKKTS